MRDWLLLARDRRFLLLWLAMLVSATGTFFLLLAVSSNLVRVHGSGIGAASVFAFQWILPVLLVSTIRRICETAGLRRTIVTSDLSGAVLSLTIGLLLAHGWVIPVLGCFLLRGFVEAITKTSRVVMVKYLFEGRQLELASSTFNLSYYLGGVLGGVLGSVLVSRVSLLGVAQISAAAFVFSASCYALLPNVTPQRRAAPVARGAIASAAAAAMKHRALFSAFCYLCVATGVFQGFHNAARTILPIRTMALSDTAVMQLQVASGIAIVLGALAVSIMPKLVKLGHFGFAVNLLASASLYATTFAQSRTQLLALYFAFIFLFEVAFTAAQSALIQTSEPEDIVTLTAGSNAIGTGLLVFFALLTGWLADQIAFRHVGLLVAACGIALGVAIEVGSHFRYSAKWKQAGRTDPAEQAAD
ncbi:MFS transporter [Burkholderia singularis]|uniref:Permease n=1 Tax=Burkholderia singularis TaxID=1503053 RepID=A0A238H3F4_9BURK|nr:MFS transporter [Burkholderia singularis]SMF99809.1 Permease [Burkholderia singularis]